MLKSKVKEESETVTVVEKVVEKLVFVKSVPYNLQGQTYTVPFPGRNFVFTITPSPTGCGFAIFSGFTGFYGSDLNETDRASLLTFIKQICVPATWHCLVATLGDNYPKFIPFLKGLGFQEVDKFNNKGYGVSYMQHIYLLKL